MRQDIGTSGGFGQLKFLTPSATFADPEAHRGPVSRRDPDRREITGAKGSIYYRAHSYHTKVPPEGIARLIEHYTKPGDVVVDPFCGSGMTGVACLMTGRRGFVSDLSPAAVHIASNYVTRADADAVLHTGADVLKRLEPLEHALQGVACRGCGAEASAEYLIWSDVFACPRCEREIQFWSAGLTEEQIVKPELLCEGCGTAWRKRDLSWLRTEPVIASTSCKSCGKRTEGPLSPTEKTAALTFDRASISAWYPTTPFENSREMWRGQHRDQGITTAADFFTPRNLSALACLWEEINRIADARTREGLRFVFTAVVNRASRRYQWNAKRPTNVLSSTLYIASLSYEFSVFSLFRRKLRVASELFRQTAELSGRAEARVAPAQDLSWLPDQSVDYVFTDPPFGSNIFYSDASFLWEAWLDHATDTTQEAVVHQSVRPEHGGKSLGDYEKLMTGAFEEIARILRPGAWASVMFHNSSDEVWSALERAVEAAGFEVGSAVAFDKGQPSFKAVKGMLSGERVPSFDLVLHLRRREGPKTGAASQPPLEVEAQVVDRLRAHLSTAPPKRRTTPYLHSLVMRLLLEEGLPLTGYTYRAVEKLCETNFLWDGQIWHAGEGSSA